ncbi:MAG TPA: hydrogenase maturation protease [Actinomycetota bacterium]|nr:hydrogenase maturation protease [Actinomycetota bacterium]
MAVVGVGNRLRGDDGIGPAVIEALGRRCRGPHVRLVCCEGDVTELIEAWSGATSVIVIDAVQSGAPPGSLHLLPLTGIGWTHRRPGSSHGLGIQEAVGLARQLGRVPGDLTLIGVEASQFELGAPLSQPAKTGVDQVVALLEYELAQAGPGVLRDAGHGARRSPAVAAANGVTARVPVS